MTDQNTAELLELLDQAISDRMSGNENPFVEEELLALRLGILSAKPLDWQPIETAPRDGSQVLLLVDWEPLWVVGYWGAATDSEHREWRVQWDESTLSGGYDEPTHWMPLKETPNKLTKPPPHRPLARNNEP